MQFRSEPNIKVWLTSEVVGLTPPKVDRKLLKRHSKGNDDVLGDLFLLVRGILALGGDGLQTTLCPIEHLVAKETILVCYPEAYISDACMYREQI